MSLTQSFLKDSFVYTVPAILSRGIGLLLIPLYTRILSPQDYGVLDLFLIVGSFIGLTVALEISQAAARFYIDSQSDVDRKAYASTSLLFTLFSYVLFAFVSLIASVPLSQIITGHDYYVTAFQLGVIYITGNGLFMFLQNQLRWELRSNDYAIVSISMTIMVALGAYCAYLMSWGLEGILGGMILGVFSGVFVAIFKLRNSFLLLFNWMKLREMLAFSLPLVPSGIFVFFSTYTDRIMISHFMTLDDVGLYAVGFRIASIVWLLMVGFQGALTPLIMKHYQSSQTPFDLERIFRHFVAFALLIFLGSSLFTREVLWLVSTPAYYDAHSVVPILALSILLSGMYIFAPGISIAKKTHLILWINLTAALCNILLNLILIPIWGIVGAALATLAGNIIAFLAYMIWSQRFYYIPYNWGLMGLVTVLMVFVGLLASQINTLSISNIIIKSMIFTLGFYILILSRMIDFQEIKVRLINLVKR